MSREDWTPPSLWYWVRMARPWEVGRTGLVALTGTGFDDPANPEEEEEEEELVGR